MVNGFIVEVKLVLSRVPYYKLFQIKTTELDCNSMAVLVAAVRYGIKVDRHDQR